MNKAQQKQFEAHRCAVEAAKVFVEEIRDMRTDYFEERSERWQDSDVGQDYQETTDEWTVAVDELENAFDAMQEIEA